MFTADWLDVIFVHYRMAPSKLTPLVPLPLDLHEGQAYVSLVAFTQSRLRPTVGGRIGELLVAPLAQLGLPLLGPDPVLVEAQGLLVRLAIGLLAEAMEVARDLHQSQARLLLAAAQLVHPFDQGRQLLPHRIQLACGVAVLLARVLRDGAAQGVVRALLRPRQP